MPNVERQSPSKRFGRWMLVLWCLNVVVTAAVALVLRHAPPGPALARLEPLIVSAAVAMWVSLGVNAFLR